VAVRPPFGPLQVLPQGLLGFFNLKSMGANPAYMPDLVQPTLDLFEWYMETNSILISGMTNTATAVGFTGWAVPTAGVTVPQSEWWWVSKYSIHSEVIAGASGDLTFRCAYANPTVPVIDYWPIGEPSLRFDPAAAIAAVDKQKICSAENFWLPPGSGLGFWVDDITGGTAIDLQGALRYSVLPI